MGQVTRVPAPRSPLDGRWRAAGIVAGLALVTLVLKPWHVPPASTTPLATPWATAPPAAARSTLPWQRWDPATLGGAAPQPAWELWAAGRVTRIRFVGPSDGFAAAPSVRPQETAVIGGPVIGLGPGETVGAIVLNRPADADVGVVRLWRFVDGGQPERVDLVELADPWAAPHIRVFALRAAGIPPDAVAAWPPGLYRLDLLIEPAARVRTLLLSVDARGPQVAVGGAGADELGPLDVRLLRRLPPAAQRWAFGRLLVGWSGRGQRDDPTCRVAEIWLARDVDDRCHPTPVGQASALGVNLGDDRRVVELRIRQVDPLPGPAAAMVSLDVNGRPGLAMARAREDRFPDGIYRVEATTAGGGVVGWYAEVSPDPTN